MELPARAGRDLQSASRMADDRVLDWLQSYWGAVVALVAVAGALWGLGEKLEKKIEQHAPLRAWIVRWLVVPSFHDGYRDWLGRRLEQLQVWMGDRWSGRAFTRCLAIAFAYPIVLMLLGYAAGGPGGVGGMQLLPSVGGWLRLVVGIAVIVLMGALVLVVAFNERIDARFQASIAVRLERRGIEDSERRARWLYLLGGAVTTTSILLAVAIFFKTSLAAAMAVALALVP